MIKQKEKYTPDWTLDIENNSFKPNWIDKIPHELWKLGEVFFPIPRRQKGWSYPHHMDEFRYSADSEELNAYLEAGWGYGIACANDLIVVDIDDLEFIDTITKHLPSTIYQVTGSRSGIHFFYYCPGLNTRQTLYRQVSVRDHAYAEGHNIFSDEITHIGEVKADSNGYVVGPESVHPSGNIYGPLKGDEIAEIEKDDLMAVISNFIKTETRNRDKWYEYENIDLDKVEIHKLYSITADEVAPWLTPEQHIAHPIHGSTHGKNFMKNADGDTFVCWRCQVGSSQACILNGTHMLAMEKAQELGELKGGDHCCEWIRNNWHVDSRLHYYAWKKALENGLINSYTIPLRVLKGYCIHNGIIEDGEKLSNEEYYETQNLLKWIIATELEDIPLNY